MYGGSYDPFTLGVAPYSRLTLVVTAAAGNVPHAIGIRVIRHGVDVTFASVAAGQAEIVDVNLATTLATEVEVRIYGASLSFPTLAIHYDLKIFAR